MSPNRILATALLFASAFASADVHIDESIPYRHAEEIDTRIVSECLQIGNVMSKSLQETAAKSDVTIVRDGKKQGTYADISITSAMSAGVAFVGHAKSITAVATLYVDGEEVNKKTFTRNSSGGMLGVYKSSCAVLNRTSKVLGSDIAQWIVSEQKTLKTNKTPI